MACKLLRPQQRRRDSRGARFTIAQFLAHDTLQTRPAPTLVRVSATGRMQCGAFVMFETLHKLSSVLQQLFQFNCAVVEADARASNSDSDYWGILARRVCRWSDRAKTPEFMWPYANPMNVSLAFIDYQT